MMCQRLFAKASIVVTFAICASALNAKPAAAQTEMVIHSFRSSSQTDGVSPCSGVVADAKGALYGTTIQGGKYGHGSVYKLVPPTTDGGAWKQNILYSFVGNGDGIGPEGGLFLDPHSGKIYGTTGSGGAQGSGVAFELAPPTKAGVPWVQSVLYAFTGLTDGGQPQNGLTSDGKGAFYGTTYLGGRHASGTVFRLSPRPRGGWIEAVLYNFNADGNGDHPQPGGLSIDETGAIYGTTQSGGTGAGTVFQLSPPLANGGPWTEKDIYTFTAVGDGNQPLGTLVRDSAGALYGATLGGGQYGMGTIFQLSPPSASGGSWTEEVLYSFFSVTDGYFPIAGVVFDSSGALNGVTENGGDISCNSPTGCGTSFKLSPPLVLGGAWTFTLLHAFSGGSDGAMPQAPLFSSGVNLYGTTYQGGPTDCGQFNIMGCGTVFEITP